MRVLGQSMEEKNNITSYRYQDLGITYSISDQYKLIHYNRKKKKKKNRVDRQRSEKKKDPKHTKDWKRMTMKTCYK